jgi:hypothetical protein
MLESQQVATWIEVFPWLKELKPSPSTNVENQAHYSKWLEIIDSSSKTLSRVQQLCGLMETKFRSRSLGLLFPNLGLDSQIGAITVSGYGDDVTLSLETLRFDAFASSSFEELLNIADLQISRPRAFIEDLLWQVLKQVDDRSNPTIFAAQESYPLGIPISEVIVEFLASIDLRERVILVDRIISESPRTLDDIGAELSVTRERVRQLEKKLLEKLGTWRSQSEDLAQLVPLYKDFIVTITTKKNLLEAFPELNEQIESLELLTWELLPAVIEGFVIDGEWVYLVEHTKLVKMFEEAFSEQAQGIGYIEASNFSEMFQEWGSCSGGELFQWALTLGYKQLVGLLLGPRTQSQHDISTALLQHRAEPMTIDELAFLVTPGKPKRNLATRLSEVSSFSRVGPDSWALTEWGLPIYDGIQNVIKRRVEAEGQVSLTELLDEFPAQYGVAASSVRLYASTFPLQLEGDIVTLATERKAVTRDTNRVRNLYFVQDKLALRMCVNGEHLRGSGIMLSSALAQALNIQPGETRSWVVPGHENPFTINWSGIQPRGSSIRSSLLEIKANLGDQIAFVFDGDKAELTQILPEEDTLESQIRAFCLIPADIEINRKTVAPAIGLPANSVWTQIMDLMRLRKDTELLDVLEQYVKTLN